MLTVSRLRVDLDYFIVCWPESHLAVKAKSSIYLWINGTTGRVRPVAASPSELRCLQWRSYFSLASQEPLGVFVRLEFLSTVCGGFVQPEILPL